MAACSPARGPASPCVGAACVDVLCSPESSVDERLHASDTLRRATEYAPEVAFRLIGCTAAALAPDVPGRAPTCQPPPVGPAKRVSVADFTAAGGRIEDYGLLSSACPSRREVLLVTADLWAGAPGGREVLTQALEDSRPGSARLARRGLAVARAPDALLSAAHDLMSRHPSMVLVAMLDIALAGDSARAYVPAIIAAADENDAADASDGLRDVVLPYVLGAIGGDSAVERLAADTRAPHVDIRRVIRALDGLGREAAFAGPALRDLAMTHCPADVRAEAAAAFEAVTGEPLVPATLPCASP